MLGPPLARITMPPRCVAGIVERRIPRVSISASACGAIGTMLRSTRSRPGRRPLEVAVVDREHHRAARVGPEDPREPVLHPPVVGSREPFRKKPWSGGGMSSWKFLSSLVSASGIAFLSRFRCRPRATAGARARLRRARASGGRARATGRRARRTSRPRPRSGSNVRSKRTSRSRRRRRVVVEAGADAGVDRGAERGRLLDDRERAPASPSTSATICGQSVPFAAPPVRTTSATSIPAISSTIAQVAARDVGRALLDRAEALDAARARRIGDVEADEPRRRVHPAARLHQVREDPEDAVRAGRELRRLALEQRVDVDAVARGLGALELAERIAEPAHHDPAVEADPLDHPAVGHGVAERAQPRLRVDQRLVEHDGAAARSCRRRR